MDLLDQMNINHDPRFQLSNQEVHNGYVYFRTPSAIKAVKELAHCWETGTIPEQEVLLRQKKDKEFAQNVGVKLSDLEKLEGFQGPHSDGWYSARCPVCAANNKDKSQNNLRIHPEKGARFCWTKWPRDDIDIWLRQLRDSK